MSPIIEFNSKHLTKGDPLPPYTGKLRLYGMRYCPFAHRTVLALNAKQVDYEIINIDLIDKPEWVLQKSGFGKVPALEIVEDLCIYESLVTVEYLDDVYPQRPLLPKDPVKKAFDKIIIEACAPIYTIYYKLVKFPDAIDEATVASYHKALDFIQEQLKSRSTTFLDGSEPGYGDYMIWPWFERLLTLDNNEKASIDGNRFNLLLEWIENMIKAPAVKAYSIPKDIYIEFHKAYGSFKPGMKLNYELLNQ